MEHGYFVSHAYEYDDTRVKIKYVTVCWKDRDILYGIKN